MTTSNDWSIISNVFAGGIAFGEVAQELNAFRLEGLGSGAGKYRVVGNVTRKLEWDNKSPFAYYTAGDKRFAVGFLSRGPREEEVHVGSAKAVYDGTLDLTHGLSGYRALTELLNKTKIASTKSILWKGGIHTFFPIRGIDLTDEYGEPLLLFRGPSYRYNVLNDERIVLSLDVATRYVDSRPYLEHIKSAGLEPLKREIEKTKREMKQLGKKSAGVHFFYSLTPMDIGIDNIDTRPIREITVDGKQSVAEFLTAKYGGQKPRDWLDLGQPGLRQGEFSYAPQFLYKNVRFQDVPPKISAQHTFYTDDAAPKDRDPEHTARTRWEKTMDLFDDYRFSTLVLGPHKIEFASSLEFPSSNCIKLPRLIAASQKPVLPSEIRAEIRKGLYQVSPVKKVFLYSSAARNLTLPFYNSMVRYALKNFSFKLPAKPTLLEPNPRDMEKQLQASLSLGSENAIVVAIIGSHGTDIHDEITNICGRLGVPSKCIAESTVEMVVNRKKSFPLAGYVSSLLTRAKCIPWVLATQLSYDCYIATDVGRAKSENWVMMIVYDKSGRYRIGQTELTVGESVDRDSLVKCINEAQALVPSAKSLLYLRDGSVYDKERNDFESVVKESGLQDSAILAIREITPFRVYRGSLSDIWRPHSGDYYVLDESNTVLCAAGADEYQHGTPSPITIDFISVAGSIDRFKAIEDVFKLSYLNWASPGKSYSTPAPLRMAHRIARELSLGIERKTVPF